MVVAKDRILRREQSNLEESIRRFVPLVKSLSSNVGAVYARIRTIQRAALLIETATKARNFEALCVVVDSDLKTALKQLASQRQDLDIVGFANKLLLLLDSIRTSAHILERHVQAFSVKRDVISVLLHDGRYALATWVSRNL